MIEKIKYLFAGFSMLLLAGIAVSCDKDEDTEIDQWMANYVYLERPVLGHDAKEFKLAHTGSGIVGDTKPVFPVSVRLLKPWTTDVRVKLSYTLDGFPDGIVSFRNGGTVIIPAGELVVRDTLDVTTDWSFVVKPKTVYNATVEIESIEPVSGELRKSINQSETRMIVTKGAFLNMSYSTTNNLTGTSIANRAAWEIVLAPNLENTDNPGRLVDGSTSSDIASNGLPYWLTIDLSQTTTVTGIYFRAYGTAYAPRAVEISTSDDGSTWVSQGQLTTSNSSNQYVTLVTPVICRHIRFEVITGSTNGRMSLTEFYVYQQTTP